MKQAFIIAEIAQAHDGSLGMAHAYIDAVAKTGCDAIKFKAHIAEAESSIHEPFRVKFSKQDASRFDYWKRMEFSIKEWKELKEMSNEVSKLIGNKSKRQKISKEAKETFLTHYTSKSHISKLKEFIEELLL
jgi:sialic acid synthase SpsE